jgi:poly(3-hydroxyalkanoate) synthetase
MLIQSKVKVSYRVIRINDISFFIFKVEEDHIYQWILGGL